MPSEPTLCLSCAELRRRAENAETLLKTYQRIIWAYVNGPESDPKARPEDARDAA